MSSVCRQRQRPALLLDGPIEAGDGDRCLQHDGALVGQVEAEQVVGRCRCGQLGHRVKAVRHSVDDRGAEDAGRVDVAASPAAGLRRAYVRRPERRARRLVERVDGVAQRGRVYDAVVDQRLGVDGVVHGPRNPACADTRNRTKRGVVSRVAVVSVVCRPRAVGDPGRRPGRGDGRAGGRSRRSRGHGGSDAQSQSRKSPRGESAGHHCCQRRNYGFPVAPFASARIAATWRAATIQNSTLRSFL